MTHSEAKQTETLEYEAEKGLYCRAMQRDKVAHGLKSPQLPEGLLQSTFKRQARGHCRVPDQPLHNSLLG